MVTKPLLDLEDQTLKKKNKSRPTSPSTHSQTKGILTSGLLLIHYFLHTHTGIRTWVRSYADTGARIAITLNRVFKKNLYRFFFTVKSTFMTK